MSLFKNTLKSAWERTLHHLKRIQSWEESTLQEMREGRKIEREVMQLKQELQQVGSAMKEETKKVKDYSYLQNLEGVQRGTRKWLEYHVREHPRALKQWKALDDKRERLEQRIQKLRNKEHKSAKRLKKHTRQTLTFLGQLEDTLEELEDMEVTQPDLSSMRSKVQTWSAWAEEAHRIACDLEDQLDNAEELWQEFQEWQRLLQIEDQLEQKGRRLFEQLNVQRPQIKRQPEVKGYTIEGSASARQIMDKDKSFLRIVKKNIERIMLWGKRAQAGKGNNNWRLLKGNIVRGSLPGARRIFFNVDGDVLKIYELTGHGRTYKKISAAISNGDYRVPATEPLDVFLPSAA